MLFCKIRSAAKTRNRKRQQKSFSGFRGGAASFEKLEMRKSSRFNREIFRISGLFLKYNFRRNRLRLYFATLLQIPNRGTFFALIKTERAEEIMKVTPEMKVKEALEINEKMLDAFVWLAPEFERLNYPKLRRAMSGRVSVKQAARIARVPLTEALYLLNLTAGEDQEKLSAELNLLEREDFEYEDENSIFKPTEIAGVLDTSERVHFVDVMEEADLKRDPMPKIVREAVRLKKPDEILLIKHPFDPIPLRDLFARRFKLGSWAEERKPGNWFIYFYRPAAVAHAVAHPPVFHKVYAMAAGV